MADKKIKGFKKFSDIKREGLDEMEEVQPGAMPDTDSSRPMLPNLPNKGKKIERFMSRKGIIPQDQNVDLDSPMVNDGEDGKKKKTNEGKVEFYGKVAKFPKKIKASKALNFLENVKISKNSIWYILVERQENERQWLKYNNKQGFDMNKFVTELKEFYIRQYKGQPKFVKLLESIEVSGAEEFSTIKNIPNIDIAPGKKLISKITEDVIKLLSK